MNISPPGILTRPYNYRNCLALNYTYLKRKVFACFSCLQALHTMKNDVSPRVDPNHTISKIR